MSYSQRSADEWQWQEARKTYHVKRFPKQRTLIWGGWVTGGDGMLFDEGIRQTYEVFLAEGAPASHATHIPPDLLAVLHDLLSGQSASARPQKRRWWQKFSDQTC